MMREAFVVVVSRSSHCRRFRPAQPAIRAVRLQDMRLRINAVRRKRFAQAQWRLSAQWRRADWWHPIRWYPPYASGDTARCSGCLLYTSRQAIVAALNGIAGVNCPTPTGAFYAFADVTALLNKPLGTNKTTFANTSELDRICSGRNGIQSRFQKQLR